MFPKIHYKIEEMKRSAVNVAEVDIGPDDAIYLLGKSKGNRDLRKTEIDRYVEEILAGRWKRVNDAAVITNQDVLINFHHRAYAVIEAGKVVPILLRINAEPDEAMYIDTGTKRNPLDATAFNKELTGIDKENVVLARLCITEGGAYYSDRDRSNNAICEWVKKYKKAIDKVRYEFFEGRSGDKFTQSVVKGAFILAFLHGVEEEILKYAAKYLLDASDRKHTQSDRYGVETLRILAKELDEGKPTSAGGSARRDTFQMTCILLKTFIENWRNPNSKEIKKRPTFVKGKGFIAYKRLWSCPDVMMIKKRQPVEMYHIRLVANSLQTCYTITAAEIARRILSTGYKITSKNPEKLVAKKFAKLVKESEGNLDVGIGVFSAVEDDEKGKILSYIYQKK